MSSILTNDSASIALMTLQSINSNIADVQSEISTGRKVAGADDNAAVWAIAKTMEADVLGYRKVSDSLALGGSTLSVARNAAETMAEDVTNLTMWTLPKRVAFRGKAGKTAAAYVRNFE